MPDDGGGSIAITWTLSPDDYDGGPVTGYEILRGESSDGPFKVIGTNVRGNTEFVDGKTTDGKDYYYRVVAVVKAVDSTGAPYKLTSTPVTAGPARSKAQWFNMRRFLCLLLTLIVSASIIIFIRKAKRGEDLYIRKIAGINAVEEAVGRATEMGRKVFYVPGIQDMNDVQTIAGIAILGRVAALAAEYETWLEVPVSKSMVMVTARETMKEAYASVGRPDSYQEAQVHYLTDDQFGYAAAIDGMVVRERPATIFYMGAFFAESLILAETGNAAGAIQIAGTAMPAQLPFFIAACDYTLIGEELFAASAYLSREPRQLGSLKGQDVGKAIFLIAILLGFILELLGVRIFGHMPSELFKVE
ncbi:MAG: fibronectin type III domain-containing protein [Candidatus Zixiibacteriota bacterium]|nr:MAG: fibronectin type III domain-containing protein [candidate division Zixibacteria bacterium]